MSMYVSTAHCNTGCEAVVRVGCHQAAQVQILSLLLPGMWALWDDGSTDIKGPGDTRQSV